ncbi:hypothetical protein [Clostridioides difficile]
MMILSFQNAKLALINRWKEALKSRELKGQNYMFLDVVTYTYL